MCPVVRGRRRGHRPRRLDDDEAAAALGGPTDRPEPLGDIIRAFTRAVIENHQDPQLLRVLIEQAPRSGELLRKITRQERSLTGLMRDLLDRHPEVRVTDTDTAARLVTSTVELTVHQLVTGPSPIDTAKLENELVAMITGYLQSSH